MVDRFSPVDSSSRAVDCRSVRHSILTSLRCAHRQPRALSSDLAKILQRKGIPMEIRGSMPACATDFRPSSTVRQSQD
nr:hypothetical protein CFP56_16212 [Quercus suber]